MNDETFYCTSSKNSKELKTCARKPPKAGPTINPVPHAALT